MTIIMKMTVFWTMTQSRLIDKKNAASTFRVEDSLKKNHQDLPKCWYVTTKYYGVMSQRQ